MKLLRILAFAATLAVMQGCAITKATLNVAATPDKQVAGPIGEINAIQFVAPQLEDKRASSGTSFAANAGARALAISKPIVRVSIDFDWIVRLIARLVAMCPRGNASVRVEDCNKRFRQRSLRQHLRN